MRIAILNGYQNERGAETFVKELSARLEKKHEVKLFLGFKKVPIRWPFLWRVFLDPHGIYTFWFTLKYIFRIFRERFDIVIPINGGWQPALIRIATWLYGGKMVISGQSGIGWDDRNNLWCFPDAFVALSSYAKNWAKRANPFVKSEYIPNGVDIRKFRPGGRKLKFNLKRPIVLTVGALTKTKRIDLVIRTIAKVKNASLLVVGEGELKEELMGMGEKLLGKRFKLVSFPYDAMPEVYRSADVFTLVSEQYYSFEIVLAEAMASDLAVVANDDPIRREIVVDAGILVDPTNIEVYAKTLEKALKTNWGDRPRKQAERFSWDRIAGNYEKLFEELFRRK